MAAGDGRPDPPRAPSAPRDEPWLFLAAVAITVVTALLYYPGPIESCSATPDAYWQVAGRCISKTDALYLSTPTRATGLLLGSAFAMLWRPVALMRGPMRNKGRLLDVVAVVGLAGLAALCWYLHIVTPEGADPWLFRGGFLVTGIATLAVIAAVTHRGAHAGRVLGMPILLWIGIRSYGLYLYHWPIYQAMRGVAGNPLSIAQFVAALAISAVLTEISFRLIETPIRKGHVGRWWRRLQAARDPAPRRIIAGAGAAMVALSVFAVATLATAELKPNEIAQSLDEAAGAVTDLDDLGVPPATDVPATDAASDPTAARVDVAPRPATRRSSCRRRADDHRRPDHDGSRRHPADPGHRRLGDARRRRRAGSRGLRRQCRGQPADEDDGAGDAAPAATPGSSATPSSCTWARTVRWASRPSTTSSPRSRACRVSWSSR